MNEDPNDPYGLLRMLLAHGVVVSALTRGWYTASCPFGDHPDQVDTGGGRVPVFQVWPTRGAWRCVECGDGGDAAALTARLAERTRA